VTGTNAPPEVQLRRAVAADAPRLAQLHAARISEGFLPSLGPRFLTRLYRRIARSPHAFGWVADAPSTDTHDGAVVAFATGADDVQRLYREFLLRDGVVAGFFAAPHVPRAWRRMLETLRYPSSTTDLPAAEVLAVATDAAAARRGHGALVVHAVTDELARRGHASVKVTVGANNEAALRFYEGCGFEPRAKIAVHGDAASEVLVWTRR
jgi:ribosomal protein S18 acetylase RimI-like enzyme